MARPGLCDTSNTRRRRLSYYTPGTPLLSTPATPHTTAIHYAPSIRQSISIRTTTTPLSILTTPSHFWKPVLNLDKLWTLIPAEERAAYLSGEKKDTVPVIDLLPLGYSKLLGKGRIPEHPIVVKARWVSALVRSPTTSHSSATH
jgi:hypothetical protein